MIQKGLFAVGFPMAISLFVIAAFLVPRRAWLQRWAVPMAAIIGICLTFVAQFHDFSGIGSRWERWKWLVLASVAALVMWPILVALRPGRRSMQIAWWAAGSLVLAAVAGRLAAGSVYPEVDQGYRWVVPLGVLVLSMVLLPLARTATLTDVAAVLIATVTTLMTVAGSGFMGAAELIAPAATAAAVLLVIAVPANAILARRARGFAVDDEVREGEPEMEKGCSVPAFAGALSLALLLPIMALVAWVNTYNRSAGYAWAMGLPMGSIGLLWVGRLPWFRGRHRWAGVVVLVLVTGVSFCGLALALREIDLRAFGFDVGGGEGSLGDYGY